MITWDNYEEYILLHADGELDEAGERELMGFVTKHPELRAELDAYDAVKLTPDTSISFAGKESLMREEPKATRVISFGGWRQYSAAAGIILVLFLAARWMVSDRNQESGISGQPSVAINQPVPDTTQPAVKEPQIANGEMEQPAIEEQKTAPAPQQTIALQKPAQQKLIAKEQMPTPEPQPTPLPEYRPEKRVDLALHPTAQENPQQIAVTNPAPQPLPQTEQSTETEESPKESRFLASLPVSEEKRAGLENLKENLTEKLAKAKNIRKELKDVTIALKLGNKELRVF